MSFDRKIRRRGLAVGLVLATAFLATGCQVRPLYDEAGVTAGNLAAIEFSDATTRVGQVVRNRLIFLAAGGAGEPAKPDYSVDLKVSSNESKLLLIDSSDTARAAQITVQATYTLVRLSDQKVLKSGKRAANALVDLSIQEFANVRAVRDAEDRAGAEVAELIRADLATALSE